MSDKEYSFIKSYDEEDEEEPMILATADELIEIARDKHNSDGEVEIDEFLMEDGKEVLPTSRISESDRGAYVMAWVWVDYDDIKRFKDG